MKPAQSPLAPAAFPVLYPIPGVRIATAQAGIKYRARDDVLLMVFDPGTTVAGVFTQSLTASAAVAWCRRNMASAGAARALIVNSGNANAFTGPLGEQCCARVGAAVARLVGGGTEQVFQASTGVIGEPLDADKIVSVLPRMADNLAPDRWPEAAAAIMTTDTFAKGVTGSTMIGDKPVHISAIAKGSGMIAPNMATLLAYFFTDAALPATVLQPLLEQANALSFNAITVDSDTSTSDTTMLFATGAAGNTRPTDADAGALDGFRQLLISLMRELAILVVRDGEGASKLIRVTVRGARSAVAAKAVAMAIANSPLVKTAIAGADANWGRVVMAVGKAGQPIDPNRLEIRFGGILIAASGAVVPGYDESRVAAHLAGPEIDIEVGLGAGDAEFSVWTCDLTHGYIRINADYRS